MNNTESKPVNIKDLLAAIDSVNEQNGWGIWIPSLAKSVIFRDITTGQQKQMVRAMIDNPVYHTNFILALYDIIKNNCTDTSVNINDLFIYDKLAIALQLRKCSIGPIFTIQQEDSDAVTVDLTTIDYTKFVPGNTVADQVTYNGIIVKFAIPTIFREVRLEKELRVKLDESDLKTYDDVRNVMAGAYIGELAKYIQSITVGGQTINLDTQDYKAIYNIIEKLPVQIIKSAVTYLEHIQKHLSNVSTLYGTNSNKEQVRAEIILDAAFFAGK